MTRELFKTRVLPLQNKLFRYAISIVAEREMAKDIVQEVLVEIWEFMEPNSSELRENVNKTTRYT